MAVVGFVDDVRPLPPLPRLALQVIGVAIVVFALPEGARVLPLLPLPVERVLLVLGGALVRQPGQFHGRHGLDERRRDGAR